MKNVVIVGGGFGGIYAARGLLRYFKNNNNICITLINPTNYFLFIPMLHEVATGTLCGHSLAEPIRELLHGKNFTFLKDTVTSVDLMKKHVRITKKSLPYDYLVLATGSEINYFGVPGAEKHTLKLKSMNDAIHLKNHLIESIEHSFSSTNAKEKKKFASVAIVGAGATGIEVAVEVREFVNQILDSNKRNKTDAQVFLIQSGDRVLPQFPTLQKNAREALDNSCVTVLCGSPVIQVMKDKVMMKNGKTIAAHTILWTAGIKPHTVKTVPKATDEKGRFIVNSMLQLGKYPDVFVIGDCASYTQPSDKQPLPALAQVATEQGKHVARNIYHHLKKQQLEPFYYKLRGVMMSLGKRKGIGIVKGVKIQGFIAWFFMRTVYLFKILGARNRMKTAWAWTLDLFMKRDTSQH
jgi:NADH:ubiquinone reductase (H+-translocating)